MAGLGLLGLLGLPTNGTRAAMNAGWDGFGPIDANQAAAAQSAPNSGLGGLLSSVGGALSDVRQQNPELLMAIGQGLMSGDMPTAFAEAGQARRQRLRDDRQVALQREGWNRDDARFDKRLAQDQSQFDAGQTLQRDRMAQDQAQFGQTFGLQKGELDLRLGKAAQERQARNATADWLESAGGNAQEVAMARSGNGADAFKMFQNRTNPQPELQSTFDSQGREQRGYFRGGDFVPVGGSKAPSASGSGLPSGFMVDPNNPSRLTPIPGGPGEQISGELAARLGLADSFLERAPGLRQKLANGDATGPIDRFASNFSGSSQAQLYQDLQSGTDALMRMLTGAGMNETEARSYAQRYLPTDTDTADSAAGKLDRLVTELNSVKATAMRGRGGTGGSAPGAGSTGGGTLSNGMKWSVK
ncbi:hypothetical protein GCM10011390_50410 [Aureimonas endophytica]|uniref:Uncharacterized protein n=1 Tax=Aureimonas endophytica TaxID=2027858 RepID=A0A917EES4_9HYPH|nr:hypothetical protein [Aureimonas endophytica]GGE24891.1 hypothetical protein GCM10011390_50410 [Aureimonas endophytica]